MLNARANDRVATPATEVAGSWRGYWGAHAFQWRDPHWQGRVADS
jgi:hypothetical protein